MHTELGSWQRAWRRELARAWRRVGKAEGETGGGGGGGRGQGGGQLADEEEEENNSDKIEQPSPGRWGKSYTSDSEIVIQPQ